MNITRMRQWVKKYGDCGVVMAAVCFGLLYLWTRRRRVLPALLLLTGLGLVLVRSQTHSGVPAAPPHLIQSLQIPRTPAKPTPPVPPKGYALEVRGDSPYVLRLYNARTKRTAWTGSFTGIGSVYSSDGTGWWSADRRAIAMPVENKTFCGIYFWREGKGVWACRRQLIRGDWDYYFDDFVWSPDHCQVLFRIGGSGSADADIGTLCCADIQKKRVYIVANAVGRRIQWNDAHTVAYHTRIYAEGKGFIESSKPDTWHCP